MNKPIIALSTWAVIATAAAGISLSNSLQNTRPEEPIVKTKISHKSSTKTDTNVAVSQAEKDKEQQENDDALLVSRAKKFLILSREYRPNAQKHHDEVEAISKKAIADEIVNVPSNTGGMQQDRFRWGTTWYGDIDVELQPGTGTSRRAVVHGVYDSSMNAGEKVDALLSLEFVNGKIDHYHAYTYTAPQSGVIQ